MSRRRFLAMCLLWSVSGFLLGFAVFGIALNPNGCNLISHPPRDWNQDQIYLVGMRMLVAPLVALNLNVRIFQGDETFVSLPFLGLLVLLLIALLIGLPRWQSQKARIGLYVALAFLFASISWLVYASFDWIPLC